ncbi:MAG TPA: hypothetical protein VGO43_01515 [Pyrinomonadaceae bacterium]|jgi:hypothetical protein|nr:hypothetical protein [Pyrinomonadaceae bacterium]
MLPIRIAILTVTLASLPTGVVAQDSQPPKGWKLVTACSFSFLLPKKARELKTQMIDSCIASYEYEDIEIGLDYGLYSAPSSEQDWMKNYQSRSVTINGREARLVTYEDTKHGGDLLRVTQLHMITGKATWGSNDVSVLMVINTKRSSDHETVKRIYESVKSIEKNK